VKKASRIVAENFSKLGLALLVFLVPEVSIRAESAPCQPVTYEHSEYTVCEVDLRRQSVKLFWKKTDGHPYEYLSSLPRALGNHSRRLLFATNGGMYRPDNSPVGLYVEEGQELVRVNTSAGPGNFHMRPNGVFYLTGEVAGILETRSFIKTKASGRLRHPIGTDAGHRRRSERSVRSIWRIKKIPSRRWQPRS
jgi:uncharacterized protein YigE (DUF2233 family)